MKFEVEKRKNKKLKLMPITHTTTGMSLDYILYEKKLQPCHCNVFDQEYLYFYYGRAKYRIKNNDVFHTPNFGTCVFIFNFVTIPNPVKAIYPFDSGAFTLYKKANFFADKCKIEDFNLGTSKEKCLDLIDKYWVNNQRYIDGLNPREVTSSEYCTTLDRMYQKLIKPSVKEFGIDDRSSSIELIYNDELNFDNLVGLIASEDMLKHNELKRISKRKGIVVEPYKYIGHTCTELQGLIDEKLEKVMNQLGVLDECK